MRVKTDLQPVCVVLGAEHDAELHEALHAVLRAAGARGLGSDWQLAGSQELWQQRLQLDVHQLEVITETFVGLSLSGPRSIVEAIVNRLQQLQLQQALRQPPAA